LNAERGLEGVRAVILDAVLNAQGKGCPPYIIGVAIGGSRDHVAYQSKRQLLRRLQDFHKELPLRAFEEGITQDINRLGIGVMGIGGDTTCLGVKIEVSNRHPATYFVDISFSCWAMRRGRLIW
jgi:fumarate hydratase class I